MILFVERMFAILDLIVFGSKILSKTVGSLHFSRMEPTYMNIIFWLITITCVQFLACILLFVYFAIQLRNTYDKNINSQLYPNKNYGVPNTNAYRTS